MKDGFRWANPSCIAADRQANLIKRKVHKQ